MPHLTPIDQCDACIPDDGCHACWKCCECQVCEDAREETTWIKHFPCPLCGCKVWATGCYPFLCICKEGCECVICCKENINTLSEAHRLTFPDGRKSYYIPPHEPSERCVNNCDNPFVCKAEWDAHIAIEALRK